MEGPTSVLMYRLIYSTNDRKSSFAWWARGDWYPDGKVRDVKELHEMLKFIGATVADSIRCDEKVTEIWVLGR